MTSLDEQITPIYLGQISRRFSSAEGRVLALPQQHGRVFSVSINKAGAAGSKVLVYDGISAAGTLVASIDATSTGVVLLGGVRCPSGIFVSVLGSGFDITVSCKGFVYEGDLTLSGNEITDGLRSIGAQGDGRAFPDSSFGIWEGTTNNIPNGGFETNTTGALINGIVTLTRITTDAKFGSASLKVDNAAGGGRGQGTYFMPTVTANIPYVFSAWLKGTAGDSYYLVAFKSAIGTVTGPDVLMDGTWQRLSLPFTLNATTPELYIGQSAANPGSVKTFYVDGVQLEPTLVATPYVETDGATASRGAARAQASASLLNATQSAFVARVRYGFASTDTRTNSAYLFDWRDDANNLCGLWLDTTNKWNAGRLAAGAGAPAQSAAQVFANGDTATVAFAATATGVKVSVNGGAFTTVANASVPTLAATLFDIGSQAGASQWDGDILWAATLTGTLSDADAAAIYSWGSADPALSDFPAAASCTMVWHADSSQYLTTR